MGNPEIQYDGPDFAHSSNRRFVLEDRISILEGLLAGLDQWHEISRVLAESANMSEAEYRLTKGEFSFTEEQADTILNTPLRRLVGDYRGLINQDLDRFRAEQHDSGWSSK